MPTHDVDYSHISALLIAIKTPWMKIIKCVNLVLLTGWILSPSYFFFFFFCSTGLFLLWIVTCNNSIYKYKSFKRHSLSFKFFFYRFTLLLLIYICIDHSLIINVFNGHIVHHVFMANEYLYHGHFLHSLSTW